MCSGPCRTKQVLGPDPAPVQAVERRGSASDLQSDDWFCWRIGDLSAVMRVLLWSDVVKKTLRCVGVP